MKPAIFMDRDGTLNQERGYLRRVEDLELLPGAAAAVRAINDAGCYAILVTNQSGPARGFYGVDHVEALHARLVKLLADEAGARLDAIYLCPHLPHGTVPDLAIECGCRKPRPGMIHQAMAAFPDLDLAASWMIGDKASDVALARAAGCRSVLVQTGYGDRVVAGKYQHLETPPDLLCADIGEAIPQVLRELALR